MAPPTATHLSNTTSDANVRDIKRMKLDRTKSQETSAVPKLVTEEPWGKNLRGDKTLVTPRPESWWTGPKPVQGCPGVQSDGKIISLPLPDMSKCSRQEVLDYFDNTWAITEVIFSALQGEEAFYRPPNHKLRHPLIFYYAHPAVLYINKLVVAGAFSAGLNPYLESVFETGVDEMSWDDMSKNEMDWPAVAEVTQYRREVYKRIRTYIETHPDLGRVAITQTHPAWALFMGFEHERIHIETSSVLYRELPLQLLKHPAEWTPYHPSVYKTDREAPKNEMVAIQAGDVLVGKPTSWPTYGWDNEYGEKTMHVRSFEVSKFKITNGEFLEFVKSGGYADASLWTETGWKWRTFRNAKWPSFWVRDGPTGTHRYKLRLIFDVVNMPWALPVDANYHEAQAYCKWLTQKEGSQISYRILTEAEHHRIRDASIRSEGQTHLPVVHDPVMHLSGADMRSKQNLNLAYGSPSAVDAFPANSNGIHDAFGNLWEWCEDHFSALPGFRMHLYYDDFSTPCFDGEHHCIQGGSFASTGDEASVFSRFHFRPHFYQHAGFRLVRTNAPLLTTCMDNPGPHAGRMHSCCSTDPNRSNSDSERDQELDLLARECTAHFGGAHLTFHGIQPFGMPASAHDFPRQCASQLISAAARLGLAKERALDVGCSVGGASFELATSFGEVTGVDISAPLIQAANTMRAKGSMKVSLKEEGDVRVTKDVHVTTSYDCTKLTFRQMDPQCISPELGPFNVVLIQNLIDRLPAPKSCLGRMGGPRGLLKKGGLVMVTSAYSWDERVTPKDTWLGGMVGEGEVAVYSKQGVHAALGEEFELVEESDLPLVVREHNRKYTLQVQHVTLWRRKL